MMEGWTALVFESCSQTEPLPSRLLLPRQMLRRHRSSTGRRVACYENVKKLALAHADVSTKCMNGIRKKRGKGICLGFISFAKEVGLRNSTRLWLKYQVNISWVALSGYWNWILRNWPVPVIRWWNWNRHIQLAEKQQKVKMQGKEMENLQNNTQGKISQNILPTSVTSLKSLQTWPPTQKSFH